MLDKIRKLLAKAEDPAATPEEAEAYAGMAMALVAKYGIDQALLDAKKVDSEREPVVDRMRTVSAPYGMEKAVLLHRVSVPLNVYIVRHSRVAGGSYPVHMFGTDSDLDRVELLFASLLIQAVRGVAAVNWVPLGETLVGYRKAWIRGFANRVGERLTEANDQAVREVGGNTTSTAMVLADRRTLAIGRAKDAYSNLKELKGPKVSVLGYGAGQRAGSQADIGSSRLGQQSATKAIG